MFMAETVFCNINCEKSLIGYLIKSSLPLLFIIFIMSGCSSMESRLKKSNQHYEYGFVYLSTENWAQAYEEFEKASSIYPENDRAFFGLGLALYFQGKFEQAIQNYKKAISINSKVPEYYNNMAAALAKLGRWEDVIKYCKIALDNPSYTTPAFAYYNIGCAYLNLDKPRKAVEFLIKSRSADSKYIDTHLQLGKALFKSGEFQDAILSLKEAKKMEAMEKTRDIPLQAEIEFYLGKAFIELGDFFSADNAFRSVIEKAPGSIFAEKSSVYLKNTQ